MYHAPEGETGQLFEFLQIRTAEDVKNGLVGVYQVFRFLRPVDEESAGHMSADFLHNGKGILCQVKMFFNHNDSID